MNNILRNKKGIVLIVSYFVLVVLLGLSTMSIVRAINESRTSRRNQDSLQAFYDAEAGIAYAYALSSQQGFIWYTHVDRDRLVNAGNLAAFEGEVGVAEFGAIGFTATYTPGVNPNINDSIDGATGHYLVTGKNFQVKSYPELDTSSNFTGVVVFLSQATVNGTTRTIEYRLGQQSAYQYFFFYPETHIFGTATYDGYNYGAIHVNGDILFAGTPRFHFLTKLSSGSDIEGEGYIRRPLKSYNDWWSSYEEVEGFYDGRRFSPDASGNVDYSGIPWYLWYNTTSHFQTGNTYFKTGDFTTGNPDDVTETTLPYYLDGSAAAWEYDKYIGTLDDANDQLPMHYNISNADLKNLATSEMTGGAGSVSIFTDNQNIGITYIPSETFPEGKPQCAPLKEDTAFQTAYNDEQSGYGIDWDSGGTTGFWGQWTTNHDSDASYSDGKNWERRFIQAAYNWSDIETPYRVNMEWWEDMEYGTDRSGLTDDLTWANVVDNSTGQELDQYFLNTGAQSEAWATWLSDNTLDAYLQDKSQEGQYVDPGTVISAQTDDAEIIQDAKTNGIYIGVDDDFAILNEFTEGTEYTTTSFYNAQHPARDGSLYVPSNILEIDVQALKNWITANRTNFNGVLYIDLNGNWVSGDPNAEGVMLVNGERLPDDVGLSVVTPNNVYIKGSYNLDPDGHQDDVGTVIGRPADDETVLLRAAEKPYINYVDPDNTNLAWQPAEIITTRAVYTLSEDFAEPAYMPLPNHHYYQYYTEQSYNDVDLIDHPRWGTPDATAWMPSSSDTTWSTIIDQWFTLSGETKPGQWTTAWIENGTGMISGEEPWGAWGASSSCVYAYDTKLANGNPGQDGVNDTFISSQDLKSALYSKVYNEYNTYYAYGNIDNTSEYEQANPVTEQHIYNTAIVSPYSTDTFTLERWGSTPRVINGAFIQLPASHQETIPAESYRPTYRSTEPAKNVNYETRFARGGSGTPATSLTFAADSSWREIKAEDF